MRINNLSKIYEIHKKHKKFFTILLTIFLILLPMFIAFYFRSFSHTLPQTEDWARETLINNIRSQVREQINAEFPFLPEVQKEIEVEKKVKEILSTNKEQIELQIKNIAESFKSRLKIDDKQSYLIGIDPEFFLRRAENIVNKGMPCDKIVEGKCWDDHMLAPFGIEMTPEFHSYLEAYTYKILRFFNKDITLLNAVFWLPAILCALCVIPAFFIVRKKAGLLGGFIAGMIVATNVAFLTRTPAGFVDTDPYNILFPLIILWLFFEAFETKNILKKIILSIMAGVVTALFAFAWVGWWFAFDIILLTIIGYVFYLIIKNIINKEKIFNKTFISPAITFGFYLLSSGLFVSLIFNLKYFLKTPFYAISFSSNILEAATMNYWPNVFTTVAELNRGTIPQIIDYSGGRLLFWIAAIGIIFTMINYKSLKELSKNDNILLWGSMIIFALLMLNKFLKMNYWFYLIIFSIPLIGGIIFSLKEKEIEVKYAILLTLWFLASMFAVTRGVRFAFLILPAFVIGIGIGFERIKMIIGDAFHYFGSIKKKFSYAISTVIVLLLLISPVKAAYNAGIREAPSFDDAWYDTLTKIKNESSSNAIITSWWDFGHWFKYWADRRVTFDGTSQDHAAAHWVGKILLTNNETEAIEILKMLDCGSNRAYETIYKNTNDTLKSIAIIKELLLKENKDAEKDLADVGFDSETVKQVITYAECEPPEAYFITSGDMIGKAPVWAHFGSWNFTRAYIYRNIRGKDIDTALNIMKAIGIDEDEGRKIYSEVVGITDEQQANTWISPWPRYLSDWISCEEKDKDFVECPLGAVIARDAEKDTVIDKISFKKGVPEVNISIGVYSGRTKIGEGSIKPSTVVIADETLRTYQLPNSDFEQAIIIRKDIEGNKTSYRIMLSEPLLADSLFTQLYFLDGRYNRRFVKFSEETTLYGEKIIVWKPIW